MFEDDQKLGIFFEDGDARRLVMLLAVCKCVICNKLMKGKSELQHHIESVHHKLLCPLCLEWKPVFPLEQVLYENLQSLIQHQNTPKLGHPQCSVCNQQFYSDDELVVHCRDKHESCHICTRNPAISASSSHFADYNHLQRHFESAHFACLDPVCLEMRFVVFAGELELRAHQQQVHFGQQKMQRSQQRMAARISVPFGSSASPVSDGNSSRNGHNDTRRQPSTSQPSTSQPYTSDTRRQNTNNTIQNTSASTEQNITIDHSWFMFEPTGTMNHAQSMANLLQLNKDFSKYLSDCRLHSKLDILRRECRRFQANQTDGRKFISFLSNQQFDVDRVCAKLSELMTDRLKQAELMRSLEEHNKIQAAFPSLPSVGPSSVITGSRGQAIQRISDAPIRGRITQNANRGVSVNPARNPLALLGSLSITGGSRPVNSNVKSPDQTQFPPLNPVPNKAINSDDDDEVFTIGGQQPTSQKESTTTKKTKKHLVMRFGGFSNPYNDT